MLEGACQEEVDRQLKIERAELKKAAESDMEKLLKAKESSMDGQFKQQVHLQVLVRVAECLPFELKKEIDISGSTVRQAFDNEPEIWQERWKGRTMDLANLAKADCCVFYLSKRQRSGRKGGKAARRKYIVKMSNDRFARWKIV